MWRPLGVSHRAATQLATQLHVTKQMINVLKRRGGGISKTIMEKQADCNVTDFEEKFDPKTYKLRAKTSRVENEYFQAYS